MCKDNRPLIGIIGGAGPEATINIQIKLLQVMKTTLFPMRDQDYYGVIIDNNPQLPDRTAEIARNSNKIIDLYIKRAQILENMGVNLLVIACNTAHAFFTQIQSSISVPLLNIIDETALHFVRKYPNIREIGLLSTLGTISSRIYHQAFTKFGVNVVLCDEIKQTEIHQAIYGIKAGFTQVTIDNIDDKRRLHKVYQKFNNNLSIKLVQSPHQIISNALQQMRSKKIFHIIMGCTELSILNNIQIDECNLIDPNQIIAETIVQYFNN